MMKRIYDQNEMSIFLSDESRRVGSAQEMDRFFEALDGIMEKRV